MTQIFPINFRKSSRILYRSAAPLNEDEARFTDHYDVKSVIDLRGRGEGHYSFSHRNQIRVGSMTRELLRSAPYYVQAAVMATWVCNRSAALKLFSNLYLNHIGLRGMMLVYASYCSKEIKTVLEFLSNEANLPAMIHCSLGKDRTGLFAAIVCLLADTPRESIVQDYLQSEGGLRNEFAKYRSSFEKMGLSEEMALVRRDAVEVVFEFIDSKGGIERYLIDYVGLSESTVRKLRELARPPPIEVVVDPKEHASKKK